MGRKENVIERYLPMSEASFLLLSCLGKENHGYGIMMEVQELTKDRVNLGAGTIYTLLYKMENDGVINATREVEKKKLYMITELGKKLYDEEVKRLSELVEIGLKKKG